MSITIIAVQAVPVPFKLAEDVITKKLNKIDQSEGFFGKEDKTSRNKRSPVELVELTSESLAKHISGFKLAEDVLL